MRPEPDPSPPALPCPQQGYRVMAVPLTSAVLRGDKREVDPDGGIEARRLDAWFPDLLVYGRAAVSHFEVKCEGHINSRPEGVRCGGGCSLVDFTRLIRSVEDIDETFEQWGWYEVNN